MNIYSITQDFDNYEFLTPMNDKDFKIIQDFKNNDVNEWHIPNCQLTKTKNRKNSVEFNASCYYSGFLFLEKEKAILLKNSFADFLDIYPIMVDEMNDDFFYIHFNQNIQAVNSIHLQNLDYKMVENGELTFNKNIIENKPFFNDSILEYLCTDRFIDFINSHHIVGLSFKKVGVVI